MSDLVGIITEQLLLLFFSGLASLLASVSGGGGGLILLPVLVLLGLPYMVALGTHKSGMLLISLGNLVRRHGTGSLNREISLVLLLLGVPGVVAGTYLVSLVPEQVARMILGALSVGMAIYSYCSKKLTAEQAGNPPTTAMRATGALLLGLIAVLAGAFSSGTGLFATMVMVLCYRLSLKEAIAHAVIFTSGVWNLVGAVVAGLIVPPAWHFLPAILLGAFGGGFAGAALLQHLSARTVKLIFCTVAAVSGVLLMR